VVPIRAGHHVIPNAIRALDSCDCDVLDVELRRPSLDDVFLSITGASPDEMSSDRAGDQQGGIEQGARR
jgi:ABC-2 type transport system ATP-binding protein